MSSLYPFPAGLLLVIPDVWERADRAVTKLLKAAGERCAGPSALSGIDQTPDPRNSGSYGTIYATRCPHVVLKFTTDPSEGFIVAQIMATPELARNPGVVNFLGVWVIKDTVVADGKKQLPVFVLLEERLVPLDLGDLTPNDIWNDQGPPGSMELSTVARRSFEYNQSLVFAQRHSNDDYFEAEARASKQNLSSALLQLESFDHARDLVSFLRAFLRETGFAMADAHLWNIGTRPGAQDWVLFDVGHTPNSGSYPVEFLQNPLALEPL